MLKLFKKEKSDYNYFSSFEEIAELIVEAAERLHEDLTNYSLVSLGEKVTSMHKIEHAADEKKKQMMHYLYQDFLPPIEREDIIQMVYTLDSVLNNIEDILLHVDMYQIESIQPNMLILLELIRKASHDVLVLIKELDNYKNPKQLLHLTEAIITIEQQADAINYQAIKQLHSETKDTYVGYRYSKVYEVFESSFDAFEDLINVVEAIILKNS